MFIFSTIYAFLSISTPDVGIDTTLTLMFWYEVVFAKHQGLQRASWKAMLGSIVHVFLFTLSGGVWGCLFPLLLQYNTRQAHQELVPAFEVLLVGLILLVHILLVLVYTIFLCPARGWYLCKWVKYVGKKFEDKERNEALNHSLGWKYFVPGTFSKCGILYAIPEVLRRHYIFREVVYYRQDLENDRRSTIEIAFEVRLRHPPQRPTRRTTREGSSVDVPTSDAPQVGIHTHTHTHSHKSL